ncbi:34608_t:CDS:2, partial [Gigaspora margarita]
VQVHIKKDRSKLSKCEKDALDFVINSIHIEENLRLIKEKFDKNLDKDHISNYGSKDNDNEKECEEIIGVRISHLDEMHFSRN